MSSTVSITSDLSLLYLLSILLQPEKTLVKGVARCTYRKVLTTYFIELGSTHPFGFVNHPIYNQSLSRPVHTNQHR